MPRCLSRKVIMRGLPPRHLQPGVACSCTRLEGSTAVARRKLAPAASRRLVQASFLRMPPPTSARQVDSKHCQIVAMMSLSALCQEPRRDKHSRTPSQCRVLAPVRQFRVFRGGVKGIDFRSVPDSLMTGLAAPHALHLVPSLPVIR